MSVHGDSAFFAEPRGQRGDYRDWAREERQQYLALQQARNAGDPALVERCRRAHSETLRRTPAAAGRRRR